MTASVLLVAHGQPSDPAPAEAEVAGLAGKVAAALPGWDVGSATLAAPEALQRALQGANAPLVFPLFMADGWFTRTALPDRLAQGGGGGCADPHTLRAFARGSRSGGQGGRTRCPRERLAAGGSHAGPRRPRIGPQPLSCGSGGGDSHVHCRRRTLCRDPYRLHRGIPLPCGLRPRRRHARNMPAAFRGPLGSCHGRHSGRTAQGGLFQESCSIRLAPCQRCRRSSPKRFGAKAHLSFAAATIRPGPGSCRITTAGSPAGASTRSESSDRPSQLPTRRQSVTIL